MWHVLKRLRREKEHSRCVSEQDKEILGWSGTERGGGYTSDKYLQGNLHPGRHSVDL